MKKYMKCPCCEEIRAKEDFKIVSKKPTTRECPACKEKLDIEFYSEKQMIAEAESSK